MRLRDQPDAHPILTGVDLALAPGEALGVLGESGSGKSTLGGAVMGLLPGALELVSGSIRVGATDFATLDGDAARLARVGVFGMVFQDPLTALNPVHRVGRQVGEALLRHGLATRADAAAEAVDLLGQVQIPEPEKVARLFPHQLSGGMRQRALIAMALALRPRFLIADEPTTALDVRVQADILELITGLRRSEGMGLIVIGHDLAVLSAVTDRVSVMYGGRFVESGPIADTYRHPRHPYTAGLLAALPSAGDGRMTPIPGAPPRPLDWPSGCSFHPRCPRATDICRTEVPELSPIDSSQPAACHHPFDRLDTRGSRA